MSSLVQRRRPRYYGPLLTSGLNSVAHSALFAVSNHAAGVARNQVLQGAQEAGRATRQAINQLAKKGKQALQDATKKGQKRTKEGQEKSKQPPVQQTNMPTNPLHEDVPIIPHKLAAKAAPDYITVTLPYANHYYVEQPGGPGTKENNLSEAAAPRIRLNSCVDPEFIGSPSNPGQIQDQTPQGYSFWAALYQYYYVKEAHVKITCINNSQSGPRRENRRIVGLQWFDEGNNQIANTRNGKLQSKRSISQLLMGADEQNGANICELQFSYTPETFQEHITELKEQNTVWTRVDQAPTLKRTLHFDACDLSGSGGNLDIDLLIEISYVVQFREPVPDLIKGPIDTSNPPPS